MTAPLISKQTNYLKENVPYYKYYQTVQNQTNSQTLFTGATATVGGTPCYTSAYSAKFSSTGGTMPSSGSGMTTSIITPSSYNNTNVTLSAWIKPSQNSLTSRTIWGCHSDSYQSGISFGMDDGSAGKLKFHPRSYSAVVKSSQYLYANTWYFIVCVYDRTNLQMRIYINGELDNSRVIDEYESSFDLDFMYIWKAGFWSSNGVSSKTTSQSCSQPFPGQMLNACVWYRALSTSEITTLYNSGSGLAIDTSVEPYTDVAIAYPMNETSGNIAYSAISGQDTGLYGTQTTYNQHVADSIFPGSSVLPNVLYNGTGGWETDLVVSTSAEFVSEVSLSKAIYPTKITVIFNNTTPKNPKSLTLQGYLNSNWYNIDNITIPSNTNQTVEKVLTSSDDFDRYRVKTTEGYTNDGLTIDKIRIDGYWVSRSEVGKHAQYDEQIQEGTHTIIGSSSDYTSIEYQNKEYEVQNV